VLLSVYLDGILRHVYAVADGEDYTRDNPKVRHIAAIAAGCGIILDALETGNLIDDRPKAGPAADIIERLTGEGRRLSPISVYRSLDYLTENGYVHRLASRSAFVACAHAHADAQPIVFLICDACGRTAEATSAAVGDALAVLASRASFTIRAQIIEVAGRCAACAA